MAPRAAALLCARGSRGARVDRREEGLCTLAPRAAALLCARGSRGASVDRREEGLCTLAPARRSRGARVGRREGALCGRACTTDVSGSTPFLLDAVPILVAVRHARIAARLELPYELGTLPFASREGL